MSQDPELAQRRDEVQEAEEGPKRINVATAAVKDAPVLDGASHITGVNLPADWLCIQVPRWHDSQVESQEDMKIDDGTRDYECMSKSKFAQLYQDNVGDDGDSLTGPEVGALVVACVLGVIVLAFIVWKSMQILKLRRERAAQLRRNADEEAEPEGVAVGDEVPPAYEITAPNRESRVPHVRDEEVSPFGLDRGRVSEGAQYHGEDRERSRSAHTPPRTVRWAEPNSIGQDDDDSPFADPIARDALEEAAEDTHHPIMRSPPPRENIWSVSSEVEEAGAEVALPTRSRSRSRSSSSSSSS